MLSMTVYTLVMTMKIKFTTVYYYLEMIVEFFFRLQPSIRREVTRYMESGHWFISLYNDDGDSQEVNFYAVVAEDMTQNCPNGCSGNGQCLLGHCQCNPGFGGDDCSESKSVSYHYQYPLKE